MDWALNLGIKLVYLQKNRKIGQLNGKTDNHRGDVEARTLIGLRERRIIDLVLFFVIFERK